MHRTGVAIFGVQSFGRALATASDRGWSAMNPAQKFGATSAAATTSLFDRHLGYACDTNRALLLSDEMEKASRQGSATCPNENAFSIIGTND
jgi:hypothetical protein